MEYQDRKKKGNKGEDIVAITFNSKDVRIPLYGGHGDKNCIAILDKHTFLDMEICNWSYKTCQLLYPKETVHIKRLLSRFYSDRQLEKAEELREKYLRKGKLVEPVQTLNVLIISYPINPRTMQILLDENINILIVGRDINVHYDFVLIDSLYWKDRVRRFKQRLPEFKKNIVLYLPTEMQYFDWYQDLASKIHGHHIIFY